MISTPSRTILLLLSFFLFATVNGGTPKVTTVQLPYGGIRPQAAIDQAGVVHIVQSNSKTRGELVYVKHVPGEESFSEPITILHEAAAMAASYNMSVGKDGRVHVITRPSPRYSKKALGAEKYDAMFKSKARFFVLRYMLHSRLNDAGTAFETETNLVGDTIGFEGVGAIVADPNSDRVYAFWPGQLEPGPEMGRDMYMAISDNAGATWSKPKKLDIDIQGNCRCCPIQGTMDASGSIYLIYRNSVKTSPKSWDKDTLLLVSNDAGKTWTRSLVQKWENCGCPGAPYSMASGPEGVYFGFSTRGTSSFAKVSETMIPIPAPSSGKNSTRPMVATNSNMDVLFSWIEMQDVVWQVFDKTGQALPNAKGRLEGVAAKWSNSAAVATPNGDFVLYHDGLSSAKAPAGK